MGPSTHIETKKIALCSLCGGHTVPRERSMAHGHGTRWVLAAICLNKGNPVFPELEFTRTVECVSFIWYWAQWCWFTWTVYDLRSKHGIFITEQMFLAAKIASFFAKKKQLAVLLENWIYKNHITCLCDSQFYRCVCVFNSVVCSFTFQFWSQNYLFMGFLN